MFKVSPELPKRRLLLIDQLAIFHSNVVLRSEIPEYNLRGLEEAVLEARDVLGKLIEIDRSLVFNLGHSSGFDGNWRHDFFVSVLDDLCFPVVFYDLEDFLFFHF